VLWLFWLTLMMSVSNSEKYGCHTWSGTRKAEFLLICREEIVADAICSQAVRTCKRFGMRAFDVDRIVSATYVCLRSSTGATEVHTGTSACLVTTTTGLLCGTKVQARSLNGNN
jgi:hypothetical protein